MVESRSENLESRKSKALSFIETNGPSLPMKIANYLKTDSLIVSAFLSELLKEKKLKLSAMKVGNSPLYYIRGQEFQLENFANFLGSKEREAFELLKQNRILLDERLHPAIRVALRSIKDFAFPFEHDKKIYWRNMKLPQEQAVEMIVSKQSQRAREGKGDVKDREEKPAIFQRIKQAVLQRDELVEKGLETRYQTEDVRVKGVEVEKKRTEFIQPRVEEKPLLVLKQEVKKGKVKEKSDFVFDVIDFLEKREFVIREELDFKKKEYFANVKIDSQLGKVDFYCIAKNKKSLTENDLMQALQASNEKKKPVLLICPGEPNKRATAKLQEIGNLVFFERLE
ncbi:hypothetical protein CMI46_01765 [Candidatus Pacearchaeota archaeon]|nr:hypothetical protein [Candidatus Pacearchaeota archaeon]|tara:strand:+ start:10329 stop:11348 length:1020 start_codon:yes stop_codon:yes gene_type:complete